MPNKTSYEPPATFPAAPKFGPAPVVAKPPTEAELAERRRQEAIAAAKGIATQSELLASDLEARRAAALAGLDKETVAGGLGIRAAQAEALAAGQAAAGSRGGSAYGALGQAAKQTGLAQAQFGAAQAKERGALDLGLAEKIGEARQAAAAQQLEALKFGEETVRPAQAKKKQYADYQQQIADILQPYKDEFYTTDEEEDQAAQEIEALADMEDDQDLKAMLLKKAADVRSGKIDI